MSFMRYIFLIFFGIHLLSSVALASDLNSFDTQIAKDIQLTEIDSAEIYQNLIAEENYNANYKPNISGMIVGGTLFGLGTFSIGGGYYLLYEYSNSEAWGTEFAAKMEGTICLLGGGLLFAIGVPLLAYNIYQYNVRKNHAEKRDEYIRAYNRYKKQKEETSLQIMLIPSINFAHNAAGLSAVVAF